MSWSTEQLAAIQARHQNLLVAAAAGSGKTSVLVERIIQRVLDEKEPVDIDRMLVVTFTNAAAAEMRERVGAALTEALKERQDAKDIERQLLLLNSASISTIHSFCQNVIRQHFHLLSISPKFRVANEVETGLLKMNLLEKLLEEKYCAAEPGFLAIVEHFSGEKNDDSLYGLVLGLYDFSRSHPKPDTWLLELTKNYTLPNDADIEDTPWSKIIRDKFILDMKGLRQGMERLTCELAEPGNPDAYIAVFRSDIAVLDGLIASGNDSWQRLYTAIHSCEFERLPSAGKEFSKEAKEYFQGERNKVKKKINDIRDTLFARSPEALLEDMRMVAPVVSALVSLVIEFGAEYTKAKRSKGLLDFSDLEHYCLEVLSEEGENGNLLPSPAAKALQEKYVEIMVDEYQDTNGVQEAILQLVARTNEPNLFMVGDVKQSIYRFRLAEPELFLQKYRSYGEKDGQQCRIDLAKNYRSRAGILQAINFLFRQVMKPDVAELEYGDAECLNPGADYPLTDEKCFKGQVEVLVLDNTSARGQDPRKEEPDEFEEQKDGQSAVEQDPEEEFTGFELESQMIVQRIKELAASGCYVWDKASKHYRPLAWRDIVILLRSVKGKADILLETLRQAGIPVYAELSEGYFQEIEVQVILSLLSIVDNPRQDIHLAGVLRSPLYEFSEAELAEIRLCNRQGDLWEAVVKAAEVLDGEQESIRLKTKNFLAQLNGWRNMTRSKGVPELVWKIYRDTGYYDYVGGLPGGVIRQANLRALYDRARQYENTNFRGLFRFLRFIEKLKDKGSDLSVARALGESEDVVRVMSIHKSKGIEFPVVFVADMNKQFNMQDSHQSVVKHKKLGLGVYASPPGVRLKYPT
ncbi:MAG TPA: helicase-exonuclease AddAB subunit AddA, partial [Ruminiclostridium sp.]|nr:helicase-exonuclease AddAB subunit AddA [Ruminiclostridium sp.]